MANIQVRFENTNIDVLFRKLFERKIYFSLFNSIQVFNGCLLPFFSTCLLICLNEPQFMRKSPQKGWTNCLLVLVVMVTLFLTCNTIMQNIFGWLVSDGHTTEGTFEIVKFSLSGVISLVAMTSLCLFTSLGKHLKESFKN